jgi:hypothetical protein
MSYRKTFVTFSGTVAERTLVESYLPIRGADGAIEGVFELYSDVTPLIVTVRMTTIKIVVSLLVAFGLLYGLLFLIVRRADQILER